MDMLNELVVDHIATTKKSVKLSSGSISELSVTTPVHYLLVSSKPNDYSPSQGGPIEELDKLEISVAALEASCAADYRPLLPCWISQKLNGVAFERLVVFEPEFTSKAQANNAWKAFQAIRLFSGEDFSRTVAACLFQNEDQIISATVMLRMMFYSAASLTVRSAISDVDLIVEPRFANQANLAFEAMKTSYNAPPSEPESVQIILQQIKKKHPTLRSSLASPKATPEKLGLTQRQFTAINNYTSKTYRYLNALLRAGNVGSSEFEFFHATIEALNTGLAQLKKKQSHNLKVFRGMHKFEGIDDIYKISNNVLEAGYTSTSARDGGAFDFEYMLKINGHLGKSVKEISNFPNEEEVLFDHGMQHLVHEFYPPEPPQSQVFITSTEEILNTANIFFTHL